MERLVEAALAKADIVLDGNRPWDLQVKDRRFFARVVAGGSLGFGEAYMDGWFECEQLDVMFYQLLRVRMQEREKFGFWKRLGLKTYARIFNPQSGRHAFDVGKRHYDAGNDLFAAMLGETMAYSCAYWKEAQTLEDAQRAKLELSCRKLRLEPGMRVLDIGCGWGSFLKHAAGRYGVHVTGVTVSGEQARAARERCRDLPVEVLLQDYRDIRGTFDRIVSIGQFEHVGPKNHRTYLELVRRNLKEGGLFLLHTIGDNVSSMTTEPWFEKYIFPNSAIPSAAQITRAAEGLWILEDWHGFGPHYDRTLMAWHERFEKAWPSFASSYGERFRRMWRYYLLSSAGAFRARHLQLWQTLWSPKGLPEMLPEVR
jgi:cyclopropane-fatty-acyl-phospholipid synthase